MTTTEGLNMTDTVTATEFRNLTTDERHRLGAASGAVAFQEQKLLAVQKERHRLWAQLAADGVRHLEIAKASGVARQAIGYAVRTQGEDANPIGQG